MTLVGKELSAKNHWKDPESRWSKQLLVDIKACKPYISTSGWISLMTFISNDVQRVDHLWHRVGNSGFLMLKSVKIRIFFGFWNLRILEDKGGKVWINLKIDIICIKRSFSLFFLRKYSKCWLSKPKFYRKLNFAHFLSGNKLTYARIRISPFDCQHL